MKIGILSAGGDCPGINATIRGVGKTAIVKYGMEVIGFTEGFRGLLNKEYVEFIGHVSRNTLYAELKNADVHLLPSIVLGTWQENQACVVQEAMFFKTLVINSTAGGVPESTAPIMRQYCVEPENVQVIIDNILKLLATRDDELREMGEQCRAFALEKYNIETLNQQMLSVCMRQGKQGR